MELGILVLRATAALAAALAIAFWYRNGSAALRHFVLATGVATAVLTLPLSGLMPAWEMAPPAAVERPALEPQARFCWGPSQLPRWPLRRHRPAGAGT